MKQKTNGFTIIEVLIVIIIIAILSVITVAGITKYMNTSREKYNKELKQQLLVSGKNFYSENKQRIPNKNNYKKTDVVTLSELTTKNYITKEFKDAQGNSCTGESYIIVRKTENGPHYNVCMKCGTNNYISTKEEKEYCNPEPQSAPPSCKESEENKNNQQKDSNVDYTYAKNYITFTVTSKLNEEKEVLINSVLTTNKNVTVILEKKENNKFKQKSTQTLSENKETKILTSEKMNNNKEIYRLSFKQNNEIIPLNNLELTLNVKTDIKYNYEYIGKAQEFNVPVDGKYKIELWGAAGNYYPPEKKDSIGQGSYTSGEIELKKGTKLYIHTGQNATTDGTFNSEAYNAGSKAAGEKEYPRTEGYHNSSSGGGATDIRLTEGEWNDPNSLKSRIMVAAGGGGTQYFEGKMKNYKQIIEGTGGAGGGLIGYEGYQKAILNYSTDIWTTEETNAYPGTSTTKVGTKYGFVGAGTQKQGGKTNPCTSSAKCDEKSGNVGTDGTLGIAGNGSLAEAGGGGGGGYYGGAGGGLAFATAREDSGLCHSSGAGGSSYISGHTGSISLKNKNNTSCKETGTNPTNYIGTTDKACSYYNNYYIFKNTTMIDGEGYIWTNMRKELVKMPSYANDSIDKGNIKSGHAKITALTTGSNSTFHYKSSDGVCETESKN